MAKVPFGHAARATRAVSSGMGPNACGYIDMALLLSPTLLADFFLTLYHFSLSCIRQQSPESIGSAGHPTTIGSPGHCIHPMGMAGVGAQERARGGLPHLHRVVSGSGSQPTTIGSPSHRSYPVGMTSVGV